MKDCSLKTIAAPQVTSPLPTGSSVPSLICQAGACALRVVVRNVSLGNTVHLAYDKPTLQTLPPGGESYELPAGASDTFIVAPNQKLFVASTGIGSMISVAISEAVIAAPGFERQEA